MLKPVLYSGFAKEICGVTRGLELNRVMLNIRTFSESGSVRGKYHPHLTFENCREQEYSRTDIAIDKDELSATVLKIAGC